MCAGVALCSVLPSTHWSCILPVRWRKEVGSRPTVPESLSVVDHKYEAAVCFVLRSFRVVDSAGDGSGWRVDSTGLSLEG